MRIFYFERVFKTFHKWSHFLWKYWLQVTRFGGYLLSDYTFTQNNSCTNRINLLLIPLAVLIFPWVGQEPHSAGCHLLSYSSLNFQFFTIVSFLSTSLWVFLKCCIRTEFCGIWPESLRDSILELLLVLPWVICLFWIPGLVLSLSCNWRPCFLNCLSGSNHWPLPESTLRLPSYVQAIATHFETQGNCGIQKTEDFRFTQDAIFPVHMWKAPWTHEALREMPALLLHL